MQSKCVRLESFSAAKASLLILCPSNQHLSELLSNMAALRSWQSHYKFFDDLESIQSWKPTPPSLPELPVIPLNRHRQRLLDRPLVIHCHDLDNGYNEHKHNLISYNFTHWAHIDTFIYFSHHTLTIPPPHWINAAHRNGVDCFGTLITEWDRGEILNRQLLHDTDTMRAYADQLVAICQHYGFDGYLVNIEAKLTDQVQRAPDDKKVVVTDVSNADNTTTHTESAHKTTTAMANLSDEESRVSVSGVDYTFRMIEFLDYLTKRLHTAVTGARVIWYDSVSAINAQLRWQSVLNDHNLPFFNVVDALFTDYHWKADMPATSFKNAGKRHRDVYTGIDLFGRGTYGGGGHNAHAAMAVITAAPTSIALFAPSWTFEGTGAAHISRNKYDDEENKLWIGTMLHTATSTSRSTSDQQLHNTKYHQCIGEYAGPRLFSLQSLLPFYCDFNSGYGHRYYEKGLCVRKDAWYDMSVQSVQVPLTDDVRRGVIKTVALLPDTSMAVSMALEYEKEECVWNGGSSLSIDCTLPPIKCPPFGPIKVELFIGRFTVDASQSVSALDSLVTLHVDCVYQYLLADSLPIEMELSLILSSNERRLVEIPLPKARALIGSWSHLNHDIKLPQSAVKCITAMNALVTINAPNTVFTQETIAASLIIGHIAITEL